MRFALASAMEIDKIKTGWTVITERGKAFLRMFVFGINEHLSYSKIASKSFLKLVQTLTLSVNTDKSMGSSCISLRNGKYNT
jgi:hypothetical protein